MKNFRKLAMFVVLVGLFPIFPVMGGEMMKEFPGKALEITTGSTESYALERKFLKIEGAFWVVEDLSGNQHRANIGTETRLTQTSKQAGKSIHGVVTKNGNPQLQLIE